MLSLLHVCSVYAVGYFLEGIVALAPFGKRALHIKLRATGGALSRSLS